MRQTAGVVALVLGLAVWLAPAASLAQGSGAATVTGVVRDTSQGALPGVTVEATSPTLVGSIRATVTDDTGTYRIEELRPGTYTVTYTLPGFSVTRREALALTPNFTATINVELSVGSLEESITVRYPEPDAAARDLARAVGGGADVPEHVGDRVVDAGRRAAAQRAGRRREHGGALHTHLDPRREDH
jgi:hypothetical protein